MKMSTRTGGDFFLHIFNVGTTQKYCNDDFKSGRNVCSGEAFPGNNRQKQSQGRRGRQPLRSEASRAKLRVKAGSSVGRSCERAGKSVVPGRLHGWRTVEVLSANSSSNEPRCTHRRSRGSCQRLKKQNMALTVQHLNKSTVHQLLQRSFSACCTRGNYKYADCGLICGWWPTFLTTPH